MDTTPLRESRDFRLLFLAGTVFYFGGMITYVAVPFQIYDITGSNFAVGAIGLVELAPILVFGLYGGALADHVDRRRLLIWTGVGQAVCTAVLALNAFRDEPDVWVIFVVAVAMTSCGALQRPSREALLPRTVRHDQLPAANALASLGIQIGLLAGPPLGGLLIAGAGIGWCFVIDVAGLLVATLLYVRMRGYPHRDGTTPPSLAAMSVARTSRRSAAATSRSTASPAAWPWPSLMVLKWSRSKTITAAGSPRFWHSSSAAAADCAKPRRFASAVSESVTDSVSSAAKALSRWRASRNAWIISSGTPASKISQSQAPS